MKPRARGVIIDARVNPPTKTPAAPLLLPIGKPVTSGDINNGRRVDTGLYDLLIEKFSRHRTTHDVVRRARGVDVAIVVAGAGGTAAALRELRILVACGTKRAVILVPPGTGSDLVETLARHLMIGSGLEGDEIPIVSIDAPPENVSEQDVERALAAIDHVIVPRDPSRFAAVAISGVQQLLVAHGETGPGARELHGADYEGRPFAATMRARTGARAGDAFFADVEGLPATRLPIDASFHSLPRPAVRRFRCAGTTAAAAGEMCFAFGGGGGWSDGRLTNNDILELDNAICPEDGKIGLVRFQGATLGPVLAVDVEDLA